jgi:hypothetical protein
MDRHMAKQQVMDVLAGHHVRYEETESRISIPPRLDTGFTVEVRFDENSAWVFCEAWHETFPYGRFDDMLNFVQFCLTDYCRLTVTYEGDVPSSYRLEYLAEGRWMLYGLVCPYDDSASSQNVRQGKQKAPAVLQNKTLRVTGKKDTP